MYIEQFCLKAEWSIADLVRQSRVDRKTIEKAMKGKSIRPLKATQIANAFSRKLGREVTIVELGISTL